MRAAAASASGSKMIPQRETAASKLACAKSRLEASDCRNSTLDRPAAAARSRTNASISAEMSVATMRPSGPALRAAVSAGSPYPAATSRTRVPECTSASSTSRSLMCPHALSLNSLHSFQPTAAESHCLCCPSRKPAGSIASDSMLALPYPPLPWTATLTDSPARPRRCSFGRIAAASSPAHVEEKQRCDAASASLNGSG